jgi:hypothetical protein
MTDTLGRRLVESVAARDVAAVTALLASDVDFKGVTPGRFWEASSPEGVVDAVLGHWFGDSDHIERVVAIEEGDPVADTQRVGYRFEVTNGDGPHLVEQQVYYRERDGRIGYLRAVCSGYRRVRD